MANKKASERLAELAQDGMSEDEAKAIVKYEIKKGSTDDDAEAVDVSALRADAQSLGALISGKPKVAKGRGAPSPDEEEEEPEGDDEEDEEEPEEDDEEDEEEVPEQKVGKGRGREANQERAFIAEMSRSIKKAMRPLHKEQAAKLGSVEQIVKGTARVMVSQAKEIAFLREENRAIRGELSQLQKALGEPEGTFKAKKSTVPSLSAVPSPYDAAGVGAGGGLPSYDDLEAHLKVELRKAKAAGDERQVDLLKGVAEDLSAPGADLVQLARRSNFSKAS